MRQRGRSRRGQRGISLIEVLVAFFILMVVSLAILQMLSMSVMVNMGALARTELQARCQQVVESIRMINIIQQAGGTVTGSGVPFPMNETTAPVAIPDDPNHSFWGRQGMNVVEPNARYRLSFTIVDGEDADNDNRVWVVTVSAVPNMSGHTYAGRALPRKVVHYVAQLPKVGP